MLSLVDGLLERLLENGGWQMVFVEEQVENYVSFCRSHVIFVLCYFCVLFTVFLKVQKLFLVLGLYENIGLSEKS